MSWVWAVLQGMCGGVVLFVVGLGGWALLQRVWHRLRRRRQPPLIFPTPPRDMDYRMSVGARDALHDEMVRELRAHGLPIIEVAPPKPFPEDSGHRP